MSTDSNDQELSSTPSPKSEPNSTRVDSASTSTPFRQAVIKAFVAELEEAAYIDWSKIENLARQKALKGHVHE